MIDTARDISLMAAMLCAAADDNNKEGVIRYINAIGQLLNKLATEVQNAQRDE